MFDASSKRTTAVVLLLPPPKLGVGIAAVADTQKNRTVGPGGEAPKGRRPCSSFHCEPQNKNKTLCSVGVGLRFRVLAPLETMSPSGGQGCMRPEGARCCLPGDVWWLVRWLGCSRRTVAQLTRWLQSHLIAGSN